jgi:type IV fimbrial biogenesis protein FimT/type IV fimbrial biogenesis protein FimU
MLKHKRSKNNGFTITELMVGVAIAGILTTIALPKLNDFIIELRVDAEISELNRLLLTARSSAINSGIDTIICPLAPKCSANWHNKVTVFIDNNNDGDYDANDTIVKVKAAIQSTDKLQYAQNSLIYTPSGTLSATPVTSPFSYCPGANTDKSRGIIVSASGRSYVTSDTNNDGKDEDRSSNLITCT